MWVIIDAGQGVARTWHSGTYAQLRIRESGTSDNIQAPDGHLRLEPALDLPTDSQVEVAVTTLALLADSTRLRILWLLGAWVRIPKPRISRAPVVYPGDPNLTMLWSGHLQSDFGPTLLGDALRCPGHHCCPGEESALAFAPVPLDLAATTLWLRSLATDVLEHEDCRGCKINAAQALDDLGELVGRRL